MPGSPAPMRTVAAPLRRWHRPKPHCRAPPDSTRRSTRWPSGSPPSSVEAGDVASELRDYAEGLAADPASLQAIEERLEAIDRLERKHGGSVESVLAHAERCREEIARLEGAEERSAEAEAALAEAEARREELGEALSAGREAAAKPLQERVAAELERLSMAGASLEVVLEPHPDGYGASGRETVELRVAPNPGIEPAPLRDAASGGELSRVMLALSGLGQAASAGTMVFDEIDAGIGGKTARVVGERLQALGRDRQVLCITHLPQVASLADVHFRLEKDVAGEQALASVERLEGEAVVAEIRRMLGAESSDEAATQHARELLAAPDRQRARSLRAFQAPSPSSGPGWPPLVVVAFPPCSGAGTARGRMRRSKAPRGSASGPSTWSSACAPARSRSSTTSTSTGSPPRS